MYFIMGQADVFTLVKFAMVLLIPIIILLSRIKIGYIEIGIGADGFYLKIKEKTGKHKGKKKGKKKDRKIDKGHNHETIALLSCCIIITLPFYITFAHLFFTSAGIT